jgi:pimeloyl-ACP methyl ester carboxylesterase
MKKTKTLLASTMAVGAMVMQGTVGSAQTATQPVSNEAIKPFEVHFPDKDLADLKNRVLATKWPDKEQVSDESQGVQSKTVKELAKYWATKYDWRKVEKRLNAVPQFITKIDGIDIHFIHVRSKEANALPILLSHGWPGSIVEFMKVIGPLTNPTAYGGKKEDAFDVVIPSMPGYGFSEKPANAGWDAPHIASAWIELMNRLGYKKYVAQGGDWGALIVDLMGVQAPEELIAIHTNMPGAVPPEIDKGAYSSAPVPSGLSAEEKHAYERLNLFYTRGLSYAQQMANHPQTLYGIADSPVGLAAWILDHDISSYELIKRVFDGQTEGLSKDDILDNITLYWLTNTGVSSSRLYWENKLGFFTPKNVTIPVAVSVFPDEIYTVSKKWAEKAYLNLIHYNRLPKGGHFAAWEQPESLVQELRTSFKSLR